MYFINPYDITTTMSPTKRPMKNIPAGWIPAMNIKEKINNHKNNLEYIIQAKTIKNVKHFYPRYL